MNEIWNKYFKNKNIEISNFGNIRSIDREINYIWQGLNCKKKIKGKLLNTFLDKNGYVLIKGFLRVHRLVAESFILNPENKPCVNHIDGNKQNNNVNNLEWCSRSENDKHAFKLGLRTQKGKNNSNFGNYKIRNIKKDKNKFSGENNNNSKITENDVVWVRNNIGKYTQKEMAERLKISQVMVSRIILRKSWSYL